MMITVVRGKVIENAAMFAIIELFVLKSSELPNDINPSFLKETENDEPSSVREISTKP